MVRRAVALLLGVGLLVGCPRAKVKLKRSPSAEPPPVRVVVVLPDATPGVGEVLGALVDMESAGKALDDAGRTLARRSGLKKGKGGDLPGDAPIWSAPAPRTSGAAKWTSWFEDALAEGVPGQATFRVVSATEALAVLDCDYSLLMQTDGSSKFGGALSMVGPVKQVGRTTKLSSRVVGVQSTKGAWQLGRCADGEVLATGKLKSVTRRLWWMLDLKRRHTVKVKGDPFGRVADDARERGDATVDWTADVAAWRAAGVGADPGSALAGRKPKKKGDYASPYLKNGKLAKWDLRELAGNVAGAATEEATRAVVREAAGQTAVSETVGAVGGAVAGGLVKRAVTGKFKADHHFDSVCDLAVWMDAAYAHRADFLLALHAAGQRHPDLPGAYRRCLQEAAEARVASGLAPPK